MKIFLLLSAIVLVVFGALLIFLPNLVKRISDFLNKTILNIEENMRAHSTVSGLILLIAGAIVFYLVLKA